MEWKQSWFFNRLPMAASVMWARWDQHEKFVIFGQKTVIFVHKPHHCCTERRWYLYRNCHFCTQNHHLCTQSRQTFASEYRQFSIEEQWKNHLCQEIVEYISKIYRIVWRCNIQRYSTCHDYYYYYSHFKEQYPQTFQEFDQDFSTTKGLSQLWFTTNFDWNGRFFQ